MLKQEKSLYTLIPIEDFKSLLGIDDREDSLARFCLITATYTIEQFCMRRLIKKKHIEQIEFTGDWFSPLTEFPVNKILAVYVLGNRDLETWSWEIVDPGFYRMFPDPGMDIDIPFYLRLSPVSRNLRRPKVFKVIYWAGYAVGKVPPDLASACLELAAWNMNRYRGRRIGMTGNVRGHGKDGEHFELSMPINVCQLLEPYRRKVV
jgi:hypothetical protein